MSTLTLTKPEHKVIEVLGSDLPETYSIIDATSICEIAELGPEFGLVDDEEYLPSQEIYDGYEAAIESLVKQGLLKESTQLGMAVYSLSDAGLDFLGDAPSA